MLTITGVDLCDDKKLLRDFSNFVLDRFVSKNVLKTALIQIRIIDRDTLSPADKKEFADVGAWVTHEGKVNGRRKFIIKMDSVAINKNAKNLMKKYKTIMKSLAHELIHVKQYLNGEMFDYKNGTTTRFKGSIYTYPTVQGMDWTYWDSPWEREAYSYMEAMYYMFNEKVKAEIAAAK